MLWLQLLGFLHLIHRSTTVLCEKVSPSKTIMLPDIVHGSLSPRLENMLPVIFLVLVFSFCPVAFWDHLNIKYKSCLNGA